MSETKRKRLSLKTKKSHFPDNVKKDDDTVNVDKRRRNESVKKIEKKKQLERIEETTRPKEENIVRESATDDVICLSDEVDGSIVVPPKYKRTSLLDVEDVQLRKLRESLLNLRRLQREQIYRELPPFPQSEILEEAAGTSREATPDTFLKYYSQEFSPLPQMCSACARRKPLRCDFDGVIKSVLDDSNQHDFDTDEGLKSLDDMILENKNFNIRSQVTGEKKKSFSNVSDSISYDSKSEKHTTDSRKTNTNPQPSTSKVGHQKSSELIEKRKNFKTGDRKTDENFTSHNSSSHSSAKVKETTDDTEANLSACPLCAMEFARGTPQLDIDAHIAACLASADDDVMW